MKKSEIKNYLENLNLNDLNNIFVRGCSNVNQTRSVDRFSITDLGFDNEDDALEFVLERIEANGANAFASVEGDSIEIEYKGVHCFTAEEYLAGAWQADSMTDAHDNIIVFRGQDLGFNFFEDGTIAKIEEIIEVFKK